MPWSMPMYPGMGGMMPPPAGVQAPGDMRGQRKQNLQNANSKGQGSQRERRRRGRAKQSKDQAVSPAPASEDGDDNHSALLTEVRKHGGKSKLTLKDVMPNVLEFCYDQTGSRFIQTKLDDANDGKGLPSATLSYQRPPNLPATALATSLCRNCSRLSMWSAKNNWQANFKAKSCDCRKRPMAAV